MFESAFNQLETVVEAGVGILGLEAIIIIGAFSAVVGVCLGIKAVRKVRE